VAAFKPTQLHQ
jgi:hypothetical protein